MKAKSRQSGITLTEMTVVIAVVALLGSLGLPAVRMLFNSFESQSGGRAVISAALATARAIAAKEQRYVGVRFQKAYDPDGPLKAPQYMIFIVHDFDKTGLVSGFRAVEGVEPIKLPDSVGVTDLMVRVNRKPTWDGAEDPTDRLIEVADLDDTNPTNFGPDGKNVYVTDTCAFSIVFSPSGKMVIHNVRVRNRDGKTDDSSNDDIFNTLFNVKDRKAAMFYQDDYANLGLGEEPSRNKFVIFDKTLFDKMDAIQRYDYLYDLEKNYINPYTGTMIEK